MQNNLMICVQFIEREIFLSHIFICDIGMRSPQSYKRYTKNRLNEQENSCGMMSVI